MLKRYPLNRDGVWLENTAHEMRLWRTLLALHFASTYFQGKTRDDGSEEISHSLKLACALFDRGLAYILDRDELDLIIAKAILHDVIENTDATKGDIAEYFGDEIAADVDRLSKKPQHKKAPGRYWWGIERSIHCVVIKAVDKEDVAGSLVLVAKTIDRLERQVNEVGKYLIPMMKRARKKKGNERFKGLFFSVRRHLRQSLDNNREIIRLRLENERLRKSNSYLRRRLRHLEKQIISVQKGLGH